MIWRQPEAILYCRDASEPVDDSRGVLTLANRFYRCLRWLAFLAGTR
jgi:hypothetical protein